MFTPLPINETFGACVANTELKLLTQLQEADENITGINFFFAHPWEILAVLKKLSEGNGEQRRQKFPAVMLFADVTQSSSSVKGLPYDVSLNFVIAMSNNKPDMQASQRISTKFVPILRPIYKELIEQLFRTGYYHLQSTNQISGNAIERLYWGREQLQGGNDAVKLNDYVDAIEVRGLKLTPTLKGTITTGNTLKVWRTVVLDIVESPARPDEVTYPIDETVFVRVGAGKLMYKQYAPGNTLKPVCHGETEGYLAGKMVEYPWYYSDNPTSIFDYDSTTGEWDESDNGGFSAGAYLTMKFLDNV